MSADVFTKLSAPFPHDEIEWRVGSTNGDKTKGLALAYLTSRHVQNRLDDVVGPENWQDRYEFHGTRTVCYLSIRVGNEWITKADAAGDSDVEAEKGSVSDALKRAAVKWGIGRYLYSLGNVWVSVEPAGRSVRIKESETPKLMSALAKLCGDAPPVGQKPDLCSRIRDEMIGVIATKADEISLRAYLSSADAKASYKSLDDAGRAAVNKATADAKARILTSLPMAGE